MSRDDEAPETFREVGIFLKNMKEDIKELKDEIDDVKNSISKMMGIVFTALIAPILVGIVLVFVVKPSK